MTVGFDMRTVPGSSRWGPRGTVGATFGVQLTFEAVSLAYGDIEAVRDVSFRLDPGEVVCLLGPSGCGKTTVLRIAAGVERPQAGRVLVDDRVVAGNGVFVPPEKRNIGLVFQDFALFPHLTIVDNVAFGLADLPRQVARTEARNALRRVGLSQYEETYPHALSGGEQQRVALARAIVPRPTVMLMDEPFSGLDQRLRESIRHETLLLLKETRATTLLVTHDPVEAMSMADRILLMRQGGMAQVGTPEDLYHRPVDMDAARFFCDFNEIEAIVEGGMARTPVGDFAAGALRESDRAMVMIRPQGVTVAGAGEPGGREGRVETSRFLGESQDLSIWLEGLDQPLLARVPAAGAPRAGETRGFCIDARHVLVFASGPAITI
jgi:iron(III) transport system ATP-binding protein